MFLPHFKGAKGLISGRGEGVARPEAEMSTMPWAYDLTSFHFGLSQRLAVVCATVFYRVNVRAAAYDNDRDAVDLGGEGSHLVDGLTAADIDPL